MITELCKKKDETGEREEGKEEQKLYNRKKPYFCDPNNHRDHDVSSST
jgi:hypothetical protein